MTENLMNSTVSFDILEAVNGDNQEQLASLVNEHRSVLNSAGSFDANVQNLAVAEFLLTKNSQQFLARLEKKAVSLNKAAAVANDSSDPVETLNALYLLHNYHFFRCLVQKHLSFDDESSRILRLDLSKVVLADSRSPRVPAFPLLKLFLLDLNSKINARDERGLPDSLARLRQLRKLRATSSTEGASREPAAYVPLLAASQFSTLSFYEQNLYCPAELEATYRVFKLAAKLALDPPKLIDKQLAKLDSAIAEIAAVPTGTSGGEPRLASDAREGAHFYESNAKTRLLRHLRALRALCAAWHLGLHRRDFKAALAALADENLLKGGRFRRAFALPAANLLAAISRAQGAASAGAALLTSQLAGKPRGAQPPKLIDAGGQNATLGVCATAFNLAVMQAEAGQLEAAMAGLEALAQPFRANPTYHYRTGLVAFRLFLARMEEAASQAEETYLASLFEDSAKFRDSRVRRYSCNAFNASEEARRRVALTTPLDSAIASFSACLRLLEHFSSERAPEAPADPSRQKKTSAFLAAARGRCDAMALSCYEHLAFLHLQAKQPLRALESLARAESCGAPADPRRLAAYSAAAWTQLGLPHKAMAKLEGLSDSKDPATISAFYPIGRTTSYQVGLSQLLQYNKAVAAYYHRDRELRTKLLDEYFHDIEETSRKAPRSPMSNYQLHLQYCHTYRERPNVVKLAEVLKSIDAQATAPVAQFQA